MEQLIKYIKEQIKAKEDLISSHEREIRRCSKHIETDLKLIEEYKEVLEKLK